MKLHICALSLTVCAFSLCSLLIRSKSIRKAGFQLVHSFYGRGNNKYSLWAETSGEHCPPHPGGVFLPVVLYTKHHFAFNGLVHTALETSATGEEFPTTTFIEGFMLSNVSEMFQLRAGSSYSLVGHHSHAWSRICGHLRCGETASSQ